MGTTINLAVADDHTMIRQTLISSLNNTNGINVVVESTNGKDLITKLKNCTSLPDICLMDINMPVMNGYDTTQKVCSLYPSVKVLAVSMFNNEFSIIQMLRNGACGFISKENDLKDLVKAIRSVYDHGFYTSSNVANAIKTMAHSKTSPNSNLLNEKEIRLIEMSCSKYTYKEIAQKLYISYNSISTILQNINNKIGISSRHELAMFAIQSGLVIS